MRMYPRIALLAAVMAACILFSGDALAQGRTYTVYFESDRDGESAVYRLEGADTVRVTELRAQHPSVTADNSMVFYTRFVETSWGKFWNIFCMLDGQEIKLTTNEIYDELEPVISRDGTFAAYTTMRVGNLEIITLPIEPHGVNELQYRVTSNEKPDEEPALASGDKWVYWTGRTGNYSYIFRAPGRGGDAERVSGVGTVWEEHPSVCAANRYMVYSAVTQEAPPEAGQGSTETQESAVQATESGGALMNGELKFEGTGEAPKASEGNSDIWILDQTTGERTRLTTDPSWEGHPCISADSEMIVFTSDRDGNYEIYIMNRDGTGLRRLTNNEAVDDFATIT